MPAERVGQKAVCLQQPAQVLGVMGAGHAKDVRMLYPQAGNPPFDLFRWQWGEAFVYPGVDDVDLFRRQSRDVGQVHLRGAAERLDALGVYRCPKSLGKAAAVAFSQGLQVFVPEEKGDQVVERDHPAGVVDSAAGKGLSHERVGGVEEIELVIQEERLDSRVEQEFVSGVRLIVCIRVSKRQGEGLQLPV